MLPIRTGRLPTTNLNLSGDVPPADSHSSFLPPRANHRDDKWGGTLAKRMNFPLAVAQTVRDALGPKLITGFRVTPLESEPGGYTLDDAKLLCNELARLNLDYISVSLDDYRN